MPAKVELQSRIQIESQQKRLCLLCQMSDWKPVVTKRTCRLFEMQLLVHSPPCLPRTRLSFAVRDWSCRLCPYPSCIKMIKPRGSPNKPATIIELPTTPLTPAQAESQRILSNMPDPDPIHGINYEWSMKDLQNWSKAEQEFRAKAAYGPNLKIKKPSKGPMTFGGRVWWSAAARLSSILILLIGIIAESLIILR